MDLNARCNFILVSDVKFLKKLQLIITPMSDFEISSSCNPELLFGHEPNFSLNATQSTGANF